MKLPKPFLNLIFKRRIPVVSDKKIAAKSAEFVFVLGGEPGSGGNGKNAGVSWSNPGTGGKGFDNESTGI